MKAIIFLLFSTLFYSYILGFYQLNHWGWDRVIWHVLWPQACLSFVMTTVQYSRPKTSGPKTFQPIHLVMGTLYASTMLVPTFLAYSNWIDFGHATLVRVSSVVFPLILEWKILLVRQRLAAMAIALSILISSYTSYIYWPHVHWGVGLALLSAFGASLLGTMQRRYYNKGWNPYGFDALMMHFINVVVITVMGSHSFGPLHVGFPLWRLYLAHGLQTAAINHFFSTRHSAFQLGLVLSAKKVLSIYLYTHTTLRSQPLYLTSVGLAFLGLLLS